MFHQIGGRIQNKAEDWKANLSTRTHKFDVMSKDDTWFQSVTVSSRIRAVTSSPKWTVNSGSSAGGKRVVRPIKLLNVLHHESFGFIKIVITSFAYPSTCRPIQYYTIHNPQPKTRLCLNNKTWRYTFGFKSILPQKYSHYYGHINQTCCLVSVTAIPILYRMLWLPHYHSPQKNKPGTMDEPVTSLAYFIAKLPLLS